MEPFRVGKLAIDGQRSRHPVHGRNTVARFHLDRRSWPESVASNERPRPADADVDDVAAEDDRHVGGPVETLYQVNLGKDLATLANPHRARPGVKA